MNCKKCRFYATNWNGFGKCRKRGWTTSDGYACGLFEAPSKPVLHVPEPEEEPTSVLLEKYRREGKA